MRYTSRSHFVITVIAVVLTSFSQPSLADDSSKSEPLMLRKIMQGMGIDMQTITDAIAREQWDKIVTIAPLIGDHSQPSFMEKMRIMRFVGSDANTFRTYDKITQQAAQTLKLAAIDKDGKAVISSFADLQNSCLSCHQHFRKSFVANFYEKL